MNSNRKGLWWQLFLAIVLHASLLLVGLINWSNMQKPQEASGMQGDISLVEGNNGAPEPIKISLDTGDVVDARQLIAKRKLDAAKAKAEEEAKAKAEEAAKAKAAEEARAKAEAEAKARAEEEQAKAKAEADAKARAEAEAKAKAEAEAKAKAEAEAKAKAEAAKKSKEDDLGKIIQESQAKQTKQSQPSKKAEQNAKYNDAFASLLGEGGGDGSRTTNASAGDFERYKAKIQNEINNNFSYNPAFIGKRCAIDVRISSDGSIAIYNGSQNGQANVCALGEQAIINTVRVTPPSNDFMSQVNRVTLVFIIK
ncbi:protein TolA [Psittacicella hinzii]|uniref:Protein TolA n=1 Tax=Psittacicella hinzii TaxID=2028575 RepID=A0A3A1YBJ9_9GAMM|nr:cell envelope integrity protein TolA [Psittacicella hinzii]RIY34560.1 protein TolA [Psittacicella hinzii]